MRIGKKRIRRQRRALYAFKKGGGLRHIAHDPFAVIAGKGRAYPLCPQIEGELTPEHGPCLIKHGVVACHESGGNGSHKLAVAAVKRSACPYGESYESALLNPHERAAREGLSDVYLVAYIVVRGRYFIRYMGSEKSPALRVGHDHIFKLAIFHEVDGYLLHYLEFASFDCLGQDNVGDDIFYLSQGLSLVSLKQSGKVFRIGQSIALKLRFKASRSYPDPRNGNGQYGNYAQKSKKKNHLCSEGFYSHLHLPILINYCRPCRPASGPGHT